MNVYDHPESFDRFTVVYRGRYAAACAERPQFIYLGMSEHPFSPLGFGQHGESNKGHIDTPDGKHLGKRIKFDELPKDCQQLTRQTFADVWR